MDSGIATQLITVAATLSGVLLTLAANASLERRKARESRELETLRLATEHARWLRDERVKTYAAFSLAGEDALQFIRSEMPQLAGSAYTASHGEIRKRWAELRIEMRKAYNQVALFGSDDAREAALKVWRAARNGGNDFLRQFEADVAAGISARDSPEQLRELVSSLGTLGDQFLKVCRNELQSDRSIPPVHHESKVTSASVS
jgi:hypothetical protein